MFGGLAFLLRGNMCCGVTGREIILRLAPERAAEALQQPIMRPFDMTGRPMKGWVLLVAVDDEDLVREWVQESWDFAAALPAKS